MQTTGYFISSAAEFTAGMKDCKYNFHCRKSCFMINSNRNTTSIIYDSDCIIRINLYLNCITISCKCFIHRIIYNLIYEMMKSP